MASIALQIILILMLIGIESYFAASEIALISARRALLQQRAEEGSKGAATLAGIGAGVNQKGPPEAGLRPRGLQASCKVISFR